MVTKTDVLVGFGTLAAAALLGTLVTGMYTGMLRSRRFEDACRQAGGMMVLASDIGVPLQTSDNPAVCASVVRTATPAQPAIAVPIPLPKLYERR